MESLSALERGRPWPLGAHWDGLGVNIAVFSANANRIDLCVFDAEGKQELSRTPLPGRTQDVWHGYLPGAAPGLVYGLRAHGPWRPERGHRFNPHKLLLDPYAREIVGTFDWSAEHLGAGPNLAHHLDPRDNAPTALKARVVADRFDWEDDRAPHTPLEQTVLYELHVKGFTRLHAGVPESLRGTYAGLASDAALAHLKALKVTAVNLLPVHQHIDEERLVKLDLSNHWGYNSIGFFCPSPRFASGAENMNVRDEFRTMVKRLHRAGIEVILDVVYNHTAEAGEDGPSISFRGLDNASYYRLPPHRKDAFENHSGCGNTIDIRHPRVLQMVMDSLRYWVQEMHVDGFRFDLAPVLGRGDHGFERNGPFFSAVAQDPVLSRVKMIAEPWDIGPGGYQVGGFPAGWLEWNDHFRDSMRSFWVQGSSTRGDFALRLCGSSDIFQPRGRSPGESVNYVVSHDGFTLRDMLSFDAKHNLANGENNRDGHNHNRNWNCGVEGPTDDPVVTALRGRLQRALLATTLLSQGTPMLAAGDELGHTQRGNNNPYCQDNEITWIDWSRADAELLAFTQRVIALRHRLLPLGDRWYDGLSDVRGRYDLAWFSADGKSLEGEGWRDPNSRVLGCLIGKPAKATEPLLLLVNAEPVDHVFTLPPGRWQPVLDTSQATGLPLARGESDPTVSLPARSLALLVTFGAEPAPLA
ncbi:MAG: isoamylase [Methylibium sp. NZG]|nr:MAG: isoamylase [Methylibium sp. NZG]